MRDGHDGPRADAPTMDKQSQVILLELEGKGPQARYNFLVH